MQRGAAYPPARILARIAARTIDLVMYLFVCGVISFAGAFYITSRCLMKHCPYSDDDLWTFFIVSIIVATGIGLIVETLSRSSIGKRALRIAIHRYQHPGKNASLWRVASRYMMLVLASLGAVGIGVLLGSTTRVDVEAATILFPFGLPPLLVWLSVLVSTLLRADRRGWHDVLAGTVLVHSSDSLRGSPHSGDPPEGSDSGSTRDADGC